jgi:hypothetical protein
MNSSFRAYFASSGFAEQVVLANVTRGRELIELSRLLSNINTTSGLRTNVTIGTYKHAAFVCPTAVGKTTLCCAR